MTRWLLLILTFASLLVWAEEDPEPRQPVTAKTKHASIQDGSLAKVIQLTEKNSPVVRKAKDAHTIARFEREIAGRQWLPQLNFTSGHGFQGTDPRDPARPTLYASNMNVVLSEKLYDNGASLTGYDIAKHREERAQIEYDLSRDQQLLAAANAYYDWSASIQQREILDNKLVLLRRQHAVLESQYKHGLKTKRDVLRIETELRRSDLSVLDADNEINLNYQKLAAAIGLSREDLEKESIEGEEAKPYVKAEGKKDEIKVENHRRARIFDIQQKEAALNTRLAARKYWPEINLTGEYGYHVWDYWNNPAITRWDANHNWGWSAMVTLNYNLWDFGIRKRQLEIERVKESSTVTQNQQSLLDLSTELRDITLRLHSYRENVRMTRELLVLEQQSYAILDAEYRNARAQYLDLITNLNTLIDARSKFISSYFGLKKQQALFLFHQGTIYETLKQK